jgi:hypothetical protein
VIPSADVSLGKLKMMDATMPYRLAKGSQPRPVGHVKPNRLVAASGCAPGQFRAVQVVAIAAAEEPCYV